jgi:methylmalonyl-CoA mutase N-terminal domain/subunit
LNKHVSEGDKTLEAQKIEIEATQNQIEKLMNFKLNRNDKIVKKALQNLRDTCNSEENIMESIIDAIRSKATLGEINGVMRDVFGTWVSPSGV